jgi:hypothetical protein
MPRPRPRRTVVVLTSALAVAGAALATPTVSSAAPASAGSAATAATPFSGQAGLFKPVGPTRIMDTRSGLGGFGTLGPAHTVALKVAGTTNVPATGVSAVVFNLTVTGPTSSGFVTAYPAGVTRPNVSTINFRKGWTGANLVTVKLGTSGSSVGKIGLYNSSGSTDLIVDVVGWYADSTGTGTTGAFQPAQPKRLWDSRPSSPLPGDHVPLGGLATLTVPVNFDTATDPHDKAVVVTLTALGPQTTGHLTAWSGAGNAPTASVLNYTAGTTVANLAIVPTSPCPSSCGPSAGLPSFSVLNASNGSTDILVDIWGFYDDKTLANGERFLPLASPIRIIDTRKELPGMTTLGTGSTRTEVAPASVAGVDTQVLVQNVTSIPASNTFLTFWRNGSPRPAVSNIQPRAGRTVAGLAYTLVGANNDFQFYNAKDRNDVLVDVAGSMELPTAKAAAAPAAAIGRVWPATVG